MIKTISNKTFYQIKDFPTLKFNNREFRKCNKFIKKYVENKTHVIDFFISPTHWPSTIMFYLEKGIITQSAPIYEKNILYTIQF